MNTEVPDSKCRVCTWILWLIVLPLGVAAFVLPWTSL